MVECQFCLRIQKASNEVCASCGGILPERVASQGEADAIAEDLSSLQRLQERTRPTGAIAWRLFVGLLFFAGIDFWSNPKSPDDFGMGLVLIAGSSIPFIISWIRRRFAPYPNTTGRVLPAIGLTLALILLFGSWESSNSPAGYIFLSAVFLTLLILRTIQLQRKDAEENETIA